MVSPNIFPTMNGSHIFLIPSRRWTGAGEGGLTSFQSCIIDNNGHVSLTGLALRHSRVGAVHAKQACLCVCVFGEREREEGGREAQPASFILSSLGTISRICRRSGDCCFPSILLGKETHFPISFFPDLPSIDFIF